MPYYLEALRRYRVRYIEGYTSSLYALAQRATEGGGRPDLGLAVVLTYAEPLAAYQRSALEREDSPPPSETYGMAEAVAAGSECDSGAMHRWPEAGILEVLADGAAVPVGQSSDYVMYRPRQPCHAAHSLPP